MLKHIVWALSIACFLSPTYASNVARVTLDGLASRSDDVVMGRVMEAVVVANEQSVFDQYEYTLEIYRSIGGETGRVKFNSNYSLRIGREYIAFLKFANVEKADYQGLYAMEVVQSKLDLNVLWLEVNTLSHLRADHVPVHVEVSKKCSARENGSDCLVVSARELISIAEVLEFVGEMRGINIDVSQWSETSLYGVGLD